MLNKNDIIFKVITTYPGDIVEGWESVEAHAYNKHTGIMIDEHMTEVFPELAEFLSDLAEGSCEPLDESLQEHEVINLIKQKGFIAI